MKYTDAQIEELHKHSIMLGQIATYVQEHAQDAEDTTLMCVLNLLDKYHACKSEQAFTALQQLKEENGHNI